jgi:K+-sensing histidine kinase KdpD
VLSESTRNNYPTVWFVVQETTALLLFIVCTSMFARRYANLSILFLLGYFFVNYFSLRVSSASAGIINLLVFTYRLFLTFLLPLWIVRASSPQSRRWGIILPAILAFLPLLLLTADSARV